MQRKFLDFSKSARLEAAESDDTNAESTEVEIRMTDDGFPIIPKVVIERDLRKAEWEKLLRAFLVQHYCEFPSDRKHIGHRDDVCKFLRVRKELNRFHMRP